MSKEVTFIFDKYDNDVDLFRTDRTDTNHMAVGSVDSIAEFLKLLARHLGNMNNGKTLYVTVKESEI